MLSGVRGGGKEQEREGLYHPALVKAFAKTVIQCIVIPRTGEHSEIRNLITKI